MSELLNPSAADGRPLFVANGFLPIPIPLEQVVKVYRQYGFDAQAVPFKISDMRDTAVYAESIGALAREATIRSGKKTTIVGISMGGVATLYGLKFLKFHYHIDTLLALGSPFHGSPIAFCGSLSVLFKKTGKQLCYNSPFLEIVRRAPMPPKVRFISIGGTYDFISPKPTTDVPEAENHLWEFGHHETILPNLHREAVRLILK